MAFSEFYMIGTGVGSNLNAGSTSSATPIYTSAAGNWASNVFTPTDGSTPASSVNVGDWVSIYPTGNTTTPYIAQVTTVGAGVNGAITLSSSAIFGTAPGTLTGTANAIDGGAWADLGMLVGGVALHTGTVSQSTCINIKANGTYTNSTTSRAFTLAGTATTPLWWRGYKSIIGDQDANNVAVAGTDIPSITFTTGQMTVGGVHQIFSNLDISGATTTANGLVSTSAADLEFYGCRSTNTAANSASKAVTSAGAEAMFCRCFFKATTTAAAVISATAGNTIFFGCTITNGIIGISASSAPILIFNCVFDSQLGDCINGGANITFYVLNCSFYNATGNGFNSTAASSSGNFIANCYFDTIAGSQGAIANTSGTNTDLVRCIANTFYACSTANYTGMGDAPILFDNGTLGSSAFTAPASQNFTPTSALSGLGFPGKFEKISAYTGTMTAGAVQLGGSSGAVTGHMQMVRGHYFIRG